MACVCSCVWSYQDLNFQLLLKSASKIMSISMWHTQWNMHQYSMTLEGTRLSRMLTIFHIQLATESEFIQIPLNHCEVYNNQRGVLGAQGISAVTVWWLPTLIFWTCTPPDFGSDSAADRSSRWPYSLSLTKYFARLRRMYHVSCVSTAGRHLFLKFKKGQGSNCYWEYYDPEE